VLSREFGFDRRLFTFKVRGVLDTQFSGTVCLAFRKPQVWSPALRKEKKVNRMNCF
jgi:hypothetical protein